MCPETRGTLSHFLFTSGRLHEGPLPFWVTLWKTSAKRTTKHTEGMECWNQFTVYHQLYLLSKSLFNISLCTWIIAHLMLSQYTTDMSLTVATHLVDKWTKRSVVAFITGGCDHPPDNPNYPGGGNSESLFNLTQKPRILPTAWRWHGEEAPLPLLGEIIDFCSMHAIIKAEDHSILWTCAVYKITSKSAYCLIYLFLIFNDLCCLKALPIAILSVVECLNKGLLFNL